jgi:hypothetical protein
VLAKAAQAVLRRYVSLLGWAADASHDFACINSAGVGMLLGRPRPADDNFNKENRRLGDLARWHSAAIASSQQR